MAEKPSYEELEQRVKELTAQVSEGKCTQALIEEAQRSEKKYREFVEGTEDLIAQVDHKGRLTYVNHKAEAIWGRKSEECLGLSAFDFIHPDDRKRTEEAFSEWICNHITSTTFENRQINQTTGNICHLHWTINLHYDDNGRITIINSIARDLTEHIHVVNEIKKNEAKRSTQ